jgi:predicted RNA-binding Zn-ribbon protein involved in translation (DUF1610 family)
MSKGLEALQKLRDLVEYLTRIDYVPRDLRDEVKELLIKSYKDSNGYFSQIEKALKRNEPMKVDLETSTRINYVEYYECPNCKGKQVERCYRYNYCPDCGQKLDRSDEK